jgi:hypothetical protein
MHHYNDILIYYVQNIDILCNTFDIWHLPTNMDMKSQINMCIHVHDIYSNWNEIWHWHK